MDHSSGIYVGKQIWISTYNGHGFEDKEGNLEAIKSSTGSFITSDNDAVIGSIRKETALAYYAYGFIDGERLGQKRVYEIICGDDKADMYVYEGFERDAPTEALKRTEHLEKEESERILTAKRILELFTSEFPSDQELEMALEKIEEYEENLYNGDMSSGHEQVIGLINVINEQIEFVGDTAYVEVCGNKLEVKKTWYTEEILRELADSYSPIIRKLVSQINNNLEKDEVVFVFLGQPLNSEIMEHYLNEMARDMYISIKIEPYFGTLVSRGNAYYNYTVNYKQRARIQKNIGRYAVELDDFYSKLDFENGKISFTDRNDFNNCHKVRIKDINNNSINQIEMYVPFSISGTTLDLTYSYIAPGLSISLKDCNCEEEWTEIIKYND